MSSVIGHLPNLILARFHFFDKHVIRTQRTEILTRAAALHPQHNRPYT